MTPIQKKKVKEYAEAIQTRHSNGWDLIGKPINFMPQITFPQLYGFAEQLIEKGLAYVDDQTAEEMRESAW